MKIRFNDKVIQCLNNTEKEDNRNIKLINNK